MTENVLAIAVQWKNMLYRYENVGQFDNFEKSQ